MSYFSTCEHVHDSAVAMQYTMSVIYKGKATHHLIQDNDGAFQVNSRNCNGASTFTEVLDSTSW